LAALLRSVATNARRPFFPTPAATWKFASGVPPLQVNPRGNSPTGTSSGSTTKPVNARGTGSFIW